MFDIGFWEMVMIAVVALVVVGPKVLPGMMRTVSGWIRHARQVAGEFKDEFSREVARADELKRLIEKETEIAEVHRAIEEARAIVDIEGKEAKSAKPGADEGAEGQGGESPPAADPEPARVRDDGPAR